MVSELRSFNFVSGPNTGPFSGANTVALTLLCGMSGLTLIPLRVNAAGFLISASGA